MLTVEVPENWFNERKWIAKTLLTRYTENLVIKAGALKQWRITCSSMPGEILLNDAYFQQAHNQNSLFEPRPFDPVKFTVTEVRGHEYKLPVLFGTAAENFNFQNHNTVTTYEINLDVFGICFWILSRIEEHCSTERDSHDRFSAYSSHAYRNGYLLDPVVDQFAQLLLSAMEKLWPTFDFKVPQFGVYASHDVDIPYLYKFTPFIKATKLIVHKAIESKSLSTAITLSTQNTVSRLGVQCNDPCDTFEWLMDQSEKISIRSEFYFIPSKGIDGKDADYEIDDPKILQLMRNIKSRGHVIGLHPSYATYRNPKLMAQEVKLLRCAIEKAGLDQSILGGRMHYLRWHQTETPNALIRAGISYDSTMGYADCPGFRAGTCHEYSYFDLVSGEETALRMRPLIAMEATVMAVRYEGLGVTQEAFDLFKNLKRKCHLVGGKFGLLWHNSSFFLKEESNLYASVLSAD